VSSREKKVGFPAYLSKSIFLDGKEFPTTWEIVAKIGSSERYSLDRVGRFFT